jgi:hypothetical protein
MANNILLSSVIIILLLRLDDDSKLHSEIDLFEKFEKLNITYGYYKFMWDRPYVSQYANQILFEDYTKKENLTEKHYIPKSIVNHMHNDYGEPPSFYDNFEMVKISHMMRPEVQKFNKYVEKSEGIYDYRWGDAVIRFFQISLFTDKIHCFRGGFSYEHQGNSIGQDKLCIEDVFAPPPNSTTSSTILNHQPVELR